MKSAAPSRRACSASPASSKPVNMTTLVSGDRVRMAGSASMPSTLGMEVSRRSRLGWNR